MGTISDGEVDTDATSVEVNAIQFLDAALSFLNGAHPNETKPSRTVGPLIIHNGDFLNSPKSTKLILKITFLGANAQSENTQHT
jgi:hypothetical protein